MNARKFKPRAYSLLLQVLPTSAAQDIIGLPNSLSLAEIYTVPCSTSSFQNLETGQVPVYNLIWIE